MRGPAWHGRQICQRPAVRQRKSLQAAGHVREAQEFCAVINPYGFHRCRNCGELLQATPNGQAVPRNLLPTREAHLPQILSTMTNSFTENVVRIRAIGTVTPICTGSESHGQKPRIHSANSRTNAMTSNMSIAPLLERVEFSVR